MTIQIFHYPTKSPLNQNPTAHAWLLTYFNEQSITKASAINYNPRARIPTKLPSFLKTKANNKKRIPQSFLILDLRAALVFNHAPFVDSHDSQQHNKQGAIPGRVLPD